MQNKNWKKIKKCQVCNKHLLNPILDIVTKTIKLECVCGWTFEKIQGHKRENELIKDFHELIANLPVST